MPTNRSIEACSAVANLLHRECTMYVLEKGVICFTLKELWDEKKYLIKKKNDPKDNLAGETDRMCIWPGRGRI